MSGQLVLLDIAAGVATLTLNRPEVLNAIDASMGAALQDAVDRAETTPGVRALLLTGAGRAFCAGGDLAQFQGAVRYSSVAGRSLEQFHPAVLRLASSPLPSVAAVRGVVAGAGIGLMLACDFAIAASDTRFSLAYPKIGATIDGGASWFLVRQVGTRRAKELAILAERFDAATALGLALVTRVVGPEALDGAASDFAMRLAMGPSAAFAEIKRLIDTAGANDLAAHLEAERAALVAIADSEDFQEGIRAFGEKRDPVFQGRGTIRRDQEC